tara:strand:- start:1205 stop:1618 length:414 start_codon:yes stop_codon:yes gene_type:complete
MASLEMSETIPQAIRRPIYRNTLIGHKNENPILFQNITSGTEMNIFETGYKETCQGETYLDNISEIPIESLTKEEASEYLYNYFKDSVWKQSGYTISSKDAFMNWLSETIPIVYRGDFNLSLWKSYGSLLISDDETV